MMDDKNYSPKHENFEDISSVSKGTQFEDIISDSSKQSAGGQMRNSHSAEESGKIYFSSITGETGKDADKYRRKKRGIAGFFSKIGSAISRWWRNLAKGQKAAVISLTSILLVICIAFGALAVFLKDFKHDSKFPTDNTDLGVYEKINDKIINIALFGIDTRKADDFNGLSDSIMILSLNTETKKVKIISLMRDSLVPIVNKGKTSYSKLNQAYAKGGPELAVKTLNTVFGLDITEYATVNFFGMEDIIDAVGGIDATLTENEINARGVGNHGVNDMIWEICDVTGRNAKKYYLTKPGKQHLNGLQAVAYSRIRYVKNIWGTNNDFGRTDRQRYVMQQLFNKALSLKKTEYPSFAKKLFPYVKTSLGVDEIVSIAMSMLLDSPEFEQCRVPMSEKGIYFLMPSPKGSFGSVVYYDLDYAGKVIKGFIYDNLTVEEFVKQNPIEKNDWYGKLFPGSTTSGTTSSKTQSGTESKPDDTPSSIPETPSDDTSSDVSGGGESDVPETPTEPTEPTEPEPTEENPQTTEPV